MKKIKVNFGNGFEVLHNSELIQAAVMVIKPGDKEGGPDNFHPGSEQWMYIIKGECEAIINEEKIKAAAGDLIFIDARERHEIKNTENENLETINFYSPKAY